MGQAGGSIRRTFSAPGPTATGAGLMMIPVTVGMLVASVVLLAAFVVIQTRSANPLYHLLIESFARITGVPMILNTSFNENEPVVCKPEEERALREAAALLDKKMSGIRDGGKIKGNDRIAVMAALGMAAEFLSVKSPQGPLSDMSILEVQTKIGAKKNGASYLDRATVRGGGAHRSRDAQCHRRPAPAPGRGDRRLRRVGGEAAGGGLRLAGRGAAADLRLRGGIGHVGVGPEGARSGSPAVARGAGDAAGARGLVLACLGSAAGFGLADGAIDLARGNLLR